MNDILANSDYPFSLDVCPECSDRVAGTATTEPSSMYKRNAAKYRDMTTTGRYIEDIDTDSKFCDLCDAHHYDFDGFRDVTARPAR